jgi:GDPmannose 4,6-dehydratase
MTSYSWQGEGLKEVGKDRCSGSILIEVDESLCRDLEVPSLQGSAKKAADVLFWKAETSFQDLVKEMVHEDLELVKRGYIIKSTL